ncbi:CDP-glycerol glycerophosphotransferase family protein [Thalassotalea profundi]|uniref:CDP-glycerol--glycerophosphate glycerophosphotransferase n=1 Tax=Thalassotalea profundi TaxID=2036687 RepID=A0ABQ3IKL5_9GAMM|nr:CDP-glycerol glycerophosphotransferase family protein [Thalassotalea profundi]GHE84233.1 CDP-glycerol--glycerophosphate glycerophosphotransferase [Thalassotalea profundi]
MSCNNKRYLFYIEQNYAFEILRPLQDAILENGNTIKWLVVGADVNCTRFTEDEDYTFDVNEAINYAPHACFVPGNVIPKFIPGLKVQVFHGLEWKKKGHFVIRDCFDLYCTHGAATTNKFSQLAKNHNFFDVVETGWPKLDNLFNTHKFNFFNNSKPIVLFAPTFSPALTSAPELFNEIKKLITEGDYNWLIKFHPKMDLSWVKKYQHLTANNCIIVNDEDINQVLQSADVMLSDTSSVIGEFSLLGKPVVTLNNSEPGSYLIDISTPEELKQALNAALAPTPDLLNAIEQYAQSLHPYKDGKSSVRIINAVEHILTNGKRATKALPYNFVRTLKARIKLNYWKL